MNDSKLVTLVTRGRNSDQPPDRPPDLPLDLDRYCGVLGLSRAPKKEDMP